MDNDNKIARHPYLPRPGSEYPGYTLVLDLDETLIHYLEGDPQSEGTFVVRPGC